MSQRTRPDVGKGVLVYYHADCFSAARLTVTGGVCQFFIDTSKDRSDSDQV